MITTDYFNYRSELLEANFKPGDIYSPKITDLGTKLEIEIINFKRFLFKRKVMSAVLFGKIVSVEPKENLSFNIGDLVILSGISDSRKRDFNNTDPLSFAYGTNFEDMKTLYEEIVNSERYLVLK